MPPSPLLWRYDEDDEDSNDNTSIIYILKSALVLTTTSIRYTTPWIEHLLAGGYTLHKHYGYTVQRDIWSELLILPGLKSAFLSVSVHMFTTFTQWLPSCARFWSQHQPSTLQADFSTHSQVALCVCVCVCKRERSGKEWERESVWVYVCLCQCV